VYGINAGTWLPVIQFDTKRLARAARSAVRSGKVRDVWSNVRLKLRTPPVWAMACVTLAIVYPRVAYNTANIRLVVAVLQALNKPRTSSHAHVQVYFKTTTSPLPERPIVDDTAAIKVRMNET
jgi:hypothetical protein